MANSKAKDIGGIARKRKEEEEESWGRRSQEHREETGGSRWKRGNPM